MRIRRKPRIKDKEKMALLAETIEKLGNEISNLAAKNNELQNIIDSHRCPNSARVARNRKFKNDINERLLAWVEKNYPDVYSEMTDWAEQDSEIKAYELALEPTGDEDKPLGER